MTSFHWLMLWLVSLLVATFLGYDRGRWAAGLLLGLVFGPLGVIAAGLMEPSAEWVAEREGALHRAIRARHRREQREARRRRQERAALQAWADDVEHQLDAEQAGFAEGLEELAGAIDQLEPGAPEPAPALRGWVHWLKAKADVVRTSPRYEKVDE